MTNIHTYTQVQRLFWVRRCFCLLSFFICYLLFVVCYLLSIVCYLSFVMHTLFVSYTTPNNTKHHQTQKKPQTTYNKQQTKKSKTRVQWSTNEPRCRCSPGGTVLIRTPDCLQPPFFELCVYMTRFVFTSE